MRTKDMAVNSIFKGHIKHIHLVGIAGIGMSGIARVLIASGFNVSGSDLNESQETIKLREAGAKVFIGHRAEHAEGADVLVYSSAIKPRNKELLSAKKNKIPIIPRAVMLAEIMRLRCGIAVAGAHGKTTTTSLIGTLMHECGLDPTLIIGGIVNHFGSNAVVGKSQFMVAEADESDGTFLHLAPSIAVVTNIDKEHLDFYEGGIDEIRATFSQFLQGLPFYGLLVACIDDPNVRIVIKDLNKRLATYGLTKKALYRADNISSKLYKTEFDLIIRGHYIDRFLINMVGEHNVLNSLAAIAVLDELGVAPAQLKEALKNFNGVKRRFSPVKAPHGFTIIDDYAHHPTEIRAVLKAARQSFHKQKIHVLFQPHRYSRTKDLMSDFATSFKDCDSLVVSEIYGAQEKPLAGVNAKVLIRKINLSMKKKAEYAKDIDEGVEKIAKLAQENDVIITLGAGSITTAGPQIALKISEGIKSATAP
jgi:UDP-N-acetylmuramate--alanine ligase